MLNESGDEREQQDVAETEAGLESVPLEGIYIPPPSPVAVILAAPAGNGYNQSRHSSIRATSPSTKSHQNNNHTSETKSPELTVAKKPPPTINIDLINRDPEFINQHLKVAFEDIFAEPHPTIFSFDFIWRASFQSFTLVKLWTYRILALICALPAAICWALYFACMAFCHIWCCVPCLRQFMINLGLAKKYFEVLMECCISPVCIAVGKILSSIRISVVKTSNYDDFHHQV